MKKKNVLIAGCGYVGCALANQLVNGKGFEIWGLRRDPSTLPDGVHAIQGNLQDIDNLGEWPSEIDYVVYCAAADEHNEEGYHRTYIQGLANVIHRLKQDRHRPARIIFTSSTSVYHQSDGDWVDENSKTNPLTFTGQTMLRAEELLHSSPFSATTVRFGGIYGPGRNRLINRVKEGTGCYAVPKVYGNRIHRDDCAGILAYLLSRDCQRMPVERLYLGVDSEPAPVHDVLHWLANELQITLDDNNPPPARGNRRCSNQLIKSQGYRFLYPDYRAGYKHLL